MTPDWQSLFASILPYIPTKIAADLTLIGTCLVSLCAVMARFIPRPADGSKWLFLYKIINQIGMNGRHAVNADDAKGIEK